MKNQKIILLGSTGSIGKNALAVIKQHPDQFSVFALTANRNIQELFLQCQAFKPVYTVVADASKAQILAEKIKEAGLKTEVLAGLSALISLAGHPEADIILAGIVGAAGLLPTMAAIKTGKRVLLANKEALVIAGQWIIEAARMHNTTLLPIDSEHNAIFQCLGGTYLPGELNPPEYVNSITLTASGGALRDVPLSKLVDIKPKQALQHPVWNMGEKITIDCATMMNKVFEVIETHWLFAMPAVKIDVVLHRQSTIHSIVNFVDGSSIAQLGHADMRIPIANALAWPKRVTSGASPINWSALSPLEFAPVDLQRYPCLHFADEIIQQGGTLGCVVNAANEIAVAEFLAGRIRFTEIFNLIEEVCERLTNTKICGLEDLLALDSEVRQRLLAKQDSL